MSVLLQLLMSFVPPTCHSATDPKSLTAVVASLGYAGSSHQWPVASPLSPDTVLSYTGAEPWHVHTALYPGYDADVSYEYEEKLTDHEIYLKEILVKLTELASTEDQFDEWRNELFRSVDYNTEEAVEVWFSDKEKLYGKRLMGQRHCISEMQHYVVESHKSDLLPQEGSIRCGVYGPPCSRWVVVNKGTQNQKRGYAWQWAQVRFTFEQYEVAPQRTNNASQIGDGVHNDSS